MVIDASALLAYLGRETGAEVVADAIADGVRISTINLAEVLSVIAEHRDAAAVVDDLTAAGLLGGAVVVVPFTHADAQTAAGLRPLTRHLGLSLADRGCLALAMRLRRPALTADAAWSDAAVTAVVSVSQIR